MKYKIHKFFKPDYPITQYYGERVEYYAQFGLKLGHEGVDYGTPNGTSVYAPFDGIILRDTFGDKDYGNFTVIWDATQKIALWFCHLQGVTTLTGQPVKQGDLLGHTNNTGNSSGPHCHVNFVETDESGNRLNKNNGNQGFLNLLDYVEFVTEAPISSPAPLVGLSIDIGYNPDHLGQTVEVGRLTYNAIDNNGILKWQVVNTTSTVETGLESHPESPGTTSTVDTPVENTEPTPPTPNPFIPKPYIPPAPVYKNSSFNFFQILVQLWENLFKSN